MNGYAISLGNEISTQLTFTATEFPIESLFYKSMQFLLQNFPSFLSKKQPKLLLTPKLLALFGTSFRFPAILFPDWNLR
jgi:hypothetical protein